MTPCAEQLLLVLGDLRTDDTQSHTRHMCQDENLRSWSLYSIDQTLSHTSSNVSSGILCSF